MASPRNGEGRGVCVCAGKAAGQGEEPVGVVEGREMPFSFFLS